MESHQLVSKPEVLEKFHDSIRLANRDDRNRSCSSVKAALPRQIVGFPMYHLQIIYMYNVVNCQIAAILMTS